ncbi:MAG: GNAT family N-acetyltransferase [Erysipelotrichaceae bacterium]|nr:GNAT family N-acetyltransferase [Erysipelotrichaceae bacterium]
MSELIKDFYQDNIVLTGDLVVLRTLEAGDREAIFHNIYHDREVQKYYMAPYIENIENFTLDRMIQSYHDNHFVVLAIIEKKSGQVIGMINQYNQLSTFVHYIETGYAIGSPYWNKGYVTEALKLFMDYCFSKNVHKVYAGCFPENPASRRVMEKAGMTYEYTRLKELYYHDRYWDVIYYSKERP